MRSTLSITIFGFILFSSSLLQGQLLWQNDTLLLKPEEGVASISGVFQFSNQGTAPITITSVKSSCGCTIHKLDKKTYAAGESGEIKATFTIGTRKGFQSKSITVKTNHPDYKSYGLRLKVQIPQSLTLFPKMLYWKKGAEKADRILRMNLPVDSSKQVKILSVKCNSTSFSHKLVENVPGKQYELRVHPTQTEKPEKAYFTIVTEVGSLVQTHKVYAYIK